MSIAIDNFINVSLTKKDAPISSLVYDTVVYVSTTATVTGYVSATTIDGDGTKKSPYTVAHITGDDDFAAWAAIFFGNGGKYIHYVKSLAKGSITLVDDTAVTILNYTDASNAVFELPLEEIIIVNNTTVISGLVGVRQKIWLKSIDDNSASSETPTEGLVLMFKESTAYIAAYYTKLRISATDSIKDLAFTAVNASTDITDVSNDDLTTALKHHINVISYLAGTYRILGGDDSLGNDVTNLFTRIVLQQTIYTALANLITTKLRLNTAGINKVKAVISATLNTYIANGYIMLDKVWPDDDLYMDGELVAVKDTPLPGGYAIHVAPITQDDITNHRIPDIYILYGDQVGVRKIVISGEVF